MTQENFDISLKRVLRHEGGYSNDPGDPGGPTMWGITHFDYDAYRRLKRLDGQDVRHMTTAERDEIYHKKYWVNGRCADLPSGVDYVMFDGAVNSGVAQSAKWLQRALGVTADGHIGDQTLLAAHRADPEAIIRSMCGQRRKFLRALKTFPLFSLGWMRRVDEVEGYAVPMVTHEDEPQHYSDAGAKASAMDISQPAVSQEAATGTMVASGGATGLVQQIQEQLAPYSYTLDCVKYVLIATMIISVGFMIYAAIKSKRAKEVL